MTINRLGPTTLHGIGPVDNINERTVDPEHVVNTYLLNAGSNDLIVDGSGTPVIFKYTVPKNEILIAHRMLIYIDDATSFSSTGFGGISALTNGVDVMANGVIIANWKDNIDIVNTMHDFIGYANLAKTDKSGSGRWTFTKTVGRPIRLNAGETFSVVINDAMAGLTTFRVRLQGCLIHARI